MGLTGYDPLPGQGSGADFIASLPSGQSASVIQDREALLIDTVKTGRAQVRWAFVTTTWKGDRRVRTGDLLEPRHRAPGESATPSLQPLRLQSFAWRECAQGRTRVFLRSKRGLGFGHGPATVGEIGR